ncbi:FAD-binding domain-containing protein [Mollisia scopiformis]|uniref:FAD-binding domain-containing protein n=1 Tax=Mollisia scopiformis TaxID=149040 RepID=A0A194XWE4_MOLSC|nr:FAD-binding domain-containing protein [Mollisia scopiformis]KUJ24620.1 FAD-binding domain-containing protein [Mollisia scopiformis]
MLSTTLWALLLSAGADAILDRRTAVGDCLTSASVPQVLPGSPAYNLTIKPFNLRIPFTPAAVVQPTTVAQVQAAVSCGAKLNIPVSPKGGGHSYASHGLGGEDGHLVVDMKYFTSVEVDSTTQIASIGTGARLGNIAQSLYSQGQRAFSHGTCPGVGVAGHVVGGGYGYISHTHGLALDNLVSATVVLANSTIVNASTTENSDLFWAIRGAGASFGIITEYRFQTFAAPNSNTVFSYTINPSSASQAAKIHSALQSYANSTSMPAEMNMRLFISPGSFNLEGIYYGSQSAFQSAVSPLLSQLGIGYGQVQTMGWIAGLSNFAYMSLSTPIDYDIHETFFSKSLMTVDLTDAAFTAFWNYWSSTARGVNRDWYLIIDLHGGPTSAISKVPDNATSYAHRNALLKYEFYDRVDSGSYPSNGFSFLNGWVSSILNAMPTTNFGMYINYADTSLTMAQAHSSYWLTHYPMLSQIKKAYDPKQVFSNPQAITSS